MKAHPVNGLDDDLPSGACLGPYRIVAPLGAGGMGRVYRAVDTRLGREVAVKTLEPDADPRRRRRFATEARIASSVSHPHVLMVLDVGEWDGRPCLVTELLVGRSLREHVRPGTLSVRQAVEYAVQVCRGLQAIHERGVVHRDLKPENVFVTADGWVKILDLGLAWSAPADETSGLETTEDAAPAGTTAYMAPEQVRRLPLDGRADLFACGVMLYEMLGRRRPFDEETAVETMTAILRREPTPLEQLDPSLPPALVRVVDRCLRKRPEDRFHSAHDLALALEASVAQRSHAVAAARPAGGRAAATGSAGFPYGRGATAWALAALVTLVVTTNLPPQAGGPLHGTTVLAGVRNPTLVRYDPGQRRFEPFLAGASIDGIDTSRDGRSIAFTAYPSGELWRANADGSGRRRLTEGPFQAALPRWSPDGTRIAFAGHAPGRPWQVHIIPADGGAIEVLAPENVTDPGWMPDGRTLVMGTLSNGQGPIFQWDLASGRRTIVPGSHGLFSPRPSPDGRYLAALDLKTWQIAILDRRSGAWSRYGGSGAGYPAWTRDGSWLHFRRQSAFSRIDPVNGCEEPVAVLDGAVPVGGEFGSWSGLAPDGSPAIIVTRDPIAG